MRRRPAVVALAATLVSALLVALVPSAAVAAPLATLLPATTTSSDFDAGNIIADSVFYQPTSMSAAQVQTFLNQQGANCAAGQQACLKDYRVTTPSVAAESGLCSAYQGVANETAAQIISKVATACGISPKVLLVLLQKESSLVSKSAPTTANYNTATGYGCPDTAACATQYYGLFNQLYKAARQFRVYRANPTKYGYQAKRNNTILYNPNAACGSSSVYIQNQATAGLYTYTPYQPNAAALANMYGTGDSCSSYGNRNFFRIFNDWFGDPRGETVAVVKALYADLLGRSPDPTGLNTWTNQLISGVPQANLVQSITGSKEYTLIRVSQAYTTVLRRQPDTNYTDWVDWVMAGRFTVDDVAFMFYESQEFYLQGGGTDTGYVQHMYQVMLGRSASAAEVSNWTNVIRTQGRNAATSGVWFSLEAALHRTIPYYTLFLGRTPDSDGQLFWAKIMLAQGEGAVRNGMAGSVEYKNRAISRFP